MTIRLRGAVLLMLAFLGGTSVAEAEPQETLEQTICRLIEASADAKNVPTEIFTRLIWRESSFRPSVTSRTGAQGIAQFMPGTATEQGVVDPFDPEEAIPASADYLAQQKQRFGNWGLAAAAYNAGPTRVANWIANGGFLPMETEDYVSFVTGRSVYDWNSADGLKDEKPKPADPSCSVIVASIRSYAPQRIEGPYEPFGVQLSGNFSKSRAIASYDRVARRYASVLAGRPTLIVGSRLAGRGRRAFYRVRLPAKTMREANSICADLRRVGGSCLVLRN